MSDFCFCRQRSKPEKPSFKELRSLLAAMSGKQEYLTGRSWRNLSPQRARWVACPWLPQRMVSFALSNWSSLAVALHGPLVFSTYSTFTPSIFHTVQIAEIYREAGIAGFWKGVLPALVMVRSCFQWAFPKLPRFL